MRPPRDLAGLFFAKIGPATLTALTETLVERSNGYSRFYPIKSIVQKSNGPTLRTPSRRELFWHASRKALLELPLRLRGREARGRLEPSIWAFAELWVP